MKIETRVLQLFFTILLISAVRIGGFFLGASSSRQKHMRDGRIAAYYDEDIDGTMLYLKCLRDDCKAEKMISNFMSEKAKEHLRHEGVKTE